MAMAPTQPDPDLQSGLQFLNAGWFDRAEPHFRAAHGRYGDRPDILHFLAVCVSRRGQIAEAAALWRKALAKDPNEPMLSFNLGLANRGLGQLDEAAKRFRDTIRRQPGHVEARLALASIHIDQGKFTASERELAETIGIIEQALENEGERWKPIQARARNMLGHVLYRLGNFATAVEVLDMAALDAGEEQARRAQILGDRALSLGGLGHHDEAIEEAHKALELAPDNAILNHVLGFVLFFAGRTAEAIAPIEKALVLDPNFTQATRTLAIVKSASGKADEAIDLLKSAVARRPHDRNILLQLSFLHIEKGEHQQAVDLLGPYLKTVPEDVRALNNLGLALRGLKRFDEAYKVLKRASRLDEDPLILTNLGQVLVDLGKPAEAKPMHEQALRALPGDARLLANYGICLAALGETDRARETLDAALAADPNNADALAARTRLDG